MTASTADATHWRRARALVSRAHGGQSIAGVERLGEGFTNAVYQVTLPVTRETFSVRVLTGNREAAAKETALLEALNVRLPVPELLAVDAADRTLPFACAIYRWIPGVTLNACRRHEAATVLDPLGEPIGRLLAAVAGCPLQVLSDHMRAALRTPQSSIDAVLEATHDRLRRDPARRRLGFALSEALADRLRRAARRLASLDSRAVLVHGDLSGRNLLVNPVRGRWQIVALLDWEHAFAGAPSWDIGSLFRYAHRYSLRFRDGFARGYRTAGGTLPDDWYRLARLLDATRLVEILGAAEDLPEVHRECRGLIADLTKGARLWDRASRSQAPARACRPDVN